MTNHPNRSTWRCQLPVPTPNEIRQAIGQMTQAEAAELANASSRSVEDWVAGTRRPDSARWELFLLRTHQHPTHRLVKLVKHNQADLHQATTPGPGTGTGDPT